MRTLHCLAASALLLSFNPAQLNAAESIWYVKTEVGPSLVNNITTVTTDSLGVMRRTKASFKPGVRFDLAGGCQINDSWAAEAEVGLIYNPVDISNSAASASPGSELGLQISHHHRA